jgi:hypothetical protein
VFRIITSSVLPSPGRIPTGWEVLVCFEDAVSVSRAFGSAPAARRSLAPVSRSISRPGKRVIALP